MGSRYISFAKENKPSDWQLITSAYKSSFEGIGFYLEKIQRPETFQHPICKKILSIEANSFHLCCRPFSEARLLPHCNNFIVAGSDLSPIDNKSFFDAKNTKLIERLSLAEKILCMTYADEAKFKKIGFKNAITLCPNINFVTEPGEINEVFPICKSFQITTHNTLRTTNMDILVEIKARKNELMFFSVIDEQDIEEDMSILLKSFNDFTATDSRQCFMILQLRSDNDQSNLRLAEAISKTWQRFFKLENKNIFLIDGQITEAGAAYLYKRADFFLNISLGEELKLPVVRAFFSGTPVISTLNKSLATFLLGTVEENNEESIFKKSNKFMSSVINSEITEVRCFSVLVGIKAGLHLGEKISKVRADKAKLDLEKSYSIEAFKKNIARLKIGKIDTV